jgi:transketolase
MNTFETTVHTIQFLAADAVEQAKSGHPGTPMALAGITTEIFSRHLRFNPQDPKWPNRDRFVLSCGHASMLLYATLHLAGYDLPKEELTRFRQWQSKTPGHPEYGHTAGVETTTGPLGQGIGNAVGMALASKILGDRLGKDIIDYRVFVLASDGDLMEGVASEAASLAGHWGLDNLVVVYDQNNITIDGKAEESFTEDVAGRFSAYGWQVSKVDGHDPEAVRAALAAATSGKEQKPHLIVAKTHIGVGLPTKQDSPKAHGSPVGRDEINGAKKAAGWPLEEFVIPEGSKTLFKQRAEQVLPEYVAWNERVEGLTADRKEAARYFLHGHVPDDLFQTLVAAHDTKTDATRSSGGRMLQVVAKALPQLLSGAADLAGSTKTDIAGGGFAGRGSFAGRNLHYGVREHGMGSIANGLSLSGIYPVVSTFLIFSDYMRPTLRLASMMGVRVTCVYTHDSFFVGEDGPTHQPIEQASSLRLIPGVDVWRPADSLECAAAWCESATRNGPNAILLTRQNLPAIERPEGFDAATIRRGAYVASPSEKPTVCLIATGSEVHVALEAKGRLEQHGHRVRVVSMPCLDAFLRWPKAEQDELLGNGARRVSVEAGTTLLWQGVVGSTGLALGIDHFGASAPAEVLQKEFGLTSEAVAKAVLASFGGAS